MLEEIEEELVIERQWMAGPPSVTAILVSHNGARWLPHTLASLLAQEHPPTTIAAVDVASTDDSADVIGTALGGLPVLNAREGTGFGDAVRMALESAPASEWVWLLHDDSAPAPDALACLLDEATRSDDIAMVGPKVREWPSLRRLLEVGLALTGTGQRETGLERGEPDQGQHDRPRDVLAVGSAGMLVRRSVWDALGGFDPGLPSYSDDIDFGWRAARAGHRARVAPRAVLFHAEAGAQGLRADSSVHASGRERRRAALFTLLVNASRTGLLWQSFRLFAGSLLRVLGLLAGKAPLEARDELVALAQVYVHPLRLLAGRRARAQTAVRSPKDVRHLLPPASLPYRHGLDSVAEIALGLVRPTLVESAGRRAVVAEVEPADAEIDELPSGRHVLVRRPWLTTVVVAVLAALIAARGLVGTGLLSGGALLPAPDTAGAWWRLFFESAHEVGTGSIGTAPPYALALAIPASLVWAKAGLVVDLLMLGVVPLAALTAHRLARTMFESSWIQAWWALTYALAIVGTGAVAQGRIGTIVALVVAPVIVRSSLAFVAEPAWKQGSRVGLWTALATAFAPLAYILALIPLLVLGLTRMAARDRRWLALPALLPFVVLGSWMWSRALNPSTWWWEAGRADAGVGALDPSVLQLALGRPDGPASAPVWLGAVLVMGGLIALLRTDRRASVLAAWGVALLGLAFAVLGAGAYLPSSNGDAPVWVGFPITIWLVALAAAAGRAADGLGSSGDGWSVPASLKYVGTAAAVVALLVPLVSGAWWVVRTVADPLQRGAASDVPAYLVTRAATGTSTLVIDGTRSRGIDFEIFRGDGDRLGDEAVAPRGEDSAAFGRVVAKTVSNPTAEDLRRLGEIGIGAIYVPAPADESITDVLDTAPGLQPSGSPDPGSRVWTFDAGVETKALDRSPARPWIAAAQVAALVVGVVLATPGRRRRNP